MVDERGGAGRGGFRLFGALIAVGGLFLIALALLVYPDRRDTHMSTGVFIWVLTLGGVFLLSGVWAFLRADATAARIAARQSEPAWADAGPALVTAAEAELKVPVIVAQRSPRTSAIAGSLGLGLIAALAPWNENAAVPIAVTITVVAVIAASVGCFRSWRMTLRIGADGILVRNYFRSYRISFSQVRCFTDGSAYANGDNPSAWALKIMLLDGRAVTVRATMSGRSRGKPPTLAAITAGARHFGIDAALTGVAPDRSRRRAGVRPPSI
jgi:hypothetical protein